MAPVFASADIAALVAAFRPPTPTNERPSLVRSLSGNHLLSSKTVSAHFRKLLQTDSGRINLKDLPSLLGIRETRWLLDCQEKAIHFSHDKQSILPEPMFERLYHQLVLEASHKFLWLDSFYEVENVAFEDVWAEVQDDDRLAHFEDSEEYRLYAVGSIRYVVSSVEYIEQTKRRIIEIIRDAEPEKAKISQQLPGVPPFVLRILIDEIRTGTDEIEGGSETGTKEVVFVPSSYFVAMGEKQRQEYASNIQQSVDALVNKGWCILPKTGGGIETLHKDVVSEFSKRTSQSEDDLDIFRLSDGQRAVATWKVLQEEIDTLKDALRTGVHLFQHKVPEITAGIEAELIEQSSNPQLATLVLQCQYRRNLKDALEDSILTMQSERFAEIQRTFWDTITVPLQLYSAGIVEESPLKDHQEDYILQHFRSEAVLRFVEQTKQQSLDTFPKMIRVKDLDKMSQQCAQAQTLADLQSAILKFSKKYEIDAPQPLQLKSVKRETLQQKVKSLEKMTRGSDVLQNLIWILLAQKSEGLFMTAGKDTSRMIRHYQAVGDAEIGRKLEVWRDLLRKGEGGKEILEEMRGLAEKTVVEMYGDVNRAGWS